MVHQDLQNQEGSVAYIVDERPRVGSQEIITAECNGNDVKMHVSYDKNRRIDKISISINKKYIDKKSISRIEYHTKGREINGVAITSCNHPARMRSVGIRIFSVVSWKTVPVFVDIGFTDGQWKLEFISDNPIVNPTFRPPPQSPVAPQ